MRISGVVTIDVNYSVTCRRDGATLWADLNWSATITYSGSWIYSQIVYGSFNGTQFAIHDGTSRWSYGGVESGTCTINCGSTWDAYSASVGLTCWEDGYGGVTDSVGLSWGNAYAAPAGVTGFTATRVSDTRTDLAWTDNPTAQAPYSVITVYRSTDGGGWVQIASLGGGATGYSDTTTSANHAYYYCANAANAAGTGFSAASNTIYNTPAAPTIGTATKTGTSTVTVAWTDNANTESAFEVARSADSGATWISISTTVAAGVTSHTDSSAPGGTVSYRVRATRGSLSSAWSARSNSVTTICAPAAPTITSGWGTYSLTGDTLRIAWQHNTLDGSAQSKADVYYSLDGGTTWVTATVTGTTSYKDLPITGKAAGVVVEAQVRTYGLYASAGPYSALASTTLAANPQCNVTTPATDGTAITDVPLVASWSYTDTYTQAGWTLQLYKAGELVNTWTGTTETSCSIPLAYLPNTNSYSLTLTVRSGSGFTATANRTFVTAYVPPTVPTVSATFNAGTLSVAVYAFAGATGTKPATDHLSLLRIDSYEGTADTVVLADPLTPGATLIDRVPRLGQDVTYRVAAVAANGAYSTTDKVVSTVVAGWVAINFGDGLSSLLRVRRNPSRSISASDDSEVLTFAGRKKPVVYTGEHTILKHSLTATVFDSDDELTAFHLLESWRGATTLRDPFGLRTHIKWTGLSETDGGGIHTVKLKLDGTEVE